MNSARVSIVEITSAPGLTFSLPAAYLQAYTESVSTLSSCFRFDRLVSYGNNDVDDIVQDIIVQAESSGIPSVLAFTIYFWNRDATRNVISCIRKLWPDVFIVVGGNDIEVEFNEDFARDSLVDFVCFGEGEEVFAEVLHEIADILSGRKLRSESPTFHRTIRQIKDIDQIPSPFLTGVITKEEVASASMIIFETNRGCPFLCSFCYWGGAVGSRVRRFSEQRIRDEIRFILRHISSGTTLFLADANFGMHKHDVTFAKLLKREVQHSKKELLLFVNWAKNTSDRVIDVAKILFESNLIGAVTLSAQSMTPAALEACGRKNIPYVQYLEMQKRFQAHGIPTYTELIIGLPPETITEFYSGVEKVLLSGGHPVVYPLLLLKNTELASVEMRSKWKLSVVQLPYQFLGSNGAVVDTVVGHQKLSREEWQNALEFVLIMALAYHVFARDTIRSICEVTGKPQVEALQAIQNALVDGTIVLHGNARAIFTNHTESLVEPKKFDRALIEACIGSNAIPDHLHYQAITIEMLGIMSENWSLFENLLQSIVGVIDGEGIGGSNKMEEAMQRDLHWVQWLAKEIFQNRSTESEGGVAPDSLLLGVYHGAVSRRVIDKEVTI